MSESIIAHYNLLIIFSCITSWCNIILSNLITASLVCLSVYMQNFPFYFLIKSWRLTKEQSFTHKHYFWLKMSIKHCSSLKWKCFVSKSNQHELICIIFKSFKTETNWVHFNLIIYFIHVHMDMSLSVWEGPKIHSRIYCSVSRERCRRKCSKN